MMTILTIEDSPDLQLLYKTVIQMSGHQCVTCETATEAREYLRTNPPPGLIMLDLTLPDLELEEFDRYFADIPGFRQIPLIVSSGRDDLAEWAQKLGALYVLKKPIDIPSFRTFLKGLNSEGPAAIRDYDGP